MRLIRFLENRLIKKRYDVKMFVFVSYVEIEIRVSQKPDLRMFLLSVLKSGVKTKF